MAHDDPESPISRSKVISFQSYKHTHRHTQWTDQTVRITKVFFPVKFDNMSRVLSVYESMGVRFAAELATIELTT